MQRVVNWMQGGDRAAFQLLNRSAKNTITDTVMPLITNLGGAIWSVVISLILLLSRDVIVIKMGERLALSLLISHLVVRLGKKFFPRLRPYLALDDVNVGRKMYKDPSFPSGHSTAAFCTATVFSSVFPALSVIFFTAAALVALSRVYLGMHYPSDITIGAAIGIIAAQFIVL
ncbi:MAG: putative undecaprenyl-diphosphatase YbjG [Candidatus Dichloromethanomonas elyunquensis]|nr:MAG: putative undecaprenyl-diphosphatase YbjG [Candidatus Dichloromethanomonas elyunquensis]